MTDTAPFVLAPLFGTQQSPINIIHDRSFRLKLGFPEFADEYSNIEIAPHCESEDHCTFKVKGVSHNLILTLQTGLTIIASLKSIHFHGPSEHTIDGSYFDAEFHFVHSIRKKSNMSGDRQIEPSENLVISLLVEKAAGIDNQMKQLASLMSFQQSDEEDDIEEAERELNEIIAQMKELIRFGFYFYRGSLTSGEYNEAVTWLVIKTAASISEEDLEQLSEFHVKQHTRDIFPTNRRIILRNFD